MVKTIIFDIDNTLLDFILMKRKSISSAVNAMIDVGLEINYNDAYDKIFEIYERKGYEYQEVFDRFIEDELGYVDYKILASAIVHYKKTKEDTLSLYPNTYETLIKLSKLGLQLGVLSDAPKREAWIRLCSLNLEHIFDNVVTFDDTGFRKPHPEPFKKICKLLDANPKFSLMVGDWPERDIFGAKCLGMKTAYAKYGNLNDQQSIDADYILRDISELVDIVKLENGV